MLGSQHLPEGVAPPQGDRHTSPAMDRCAKGEGQFFRSFFIASCARRTLMSSPPPGSVCLHTTQGAGTAVTADEAPQHKVVSGRQPATRTRGNARSGLGNPWLTCRRCSTAQAWPPVRLYPPSNKSLCFYAGGARPRIEMCVHLGTVEFRPCDCDSRLAIRCYTGTDC